MTNILVRPSVTFQNESWKISFKSVDTETEHYFYDRFSPLDYLLQNRAIFLDLNKSFFKINFFSLLRHILLLLLLFHYIILCLLMICLLMIYLTVCHCNCVSSISELLTFTKKGFQNTA